MIIELTKCEGKIKLDIENGGGSITSDLHDFCLECGKEVHDENCPDADDKDVELYNASIDGLESLILALACAGIDVEDEQFQIGVQNAITGIAANHS